MLYQARKAKKEEDRKFWVEGLKSIVERDSKLDKQLVVRMNKLHTWHYLKVAHWYIVNERKKYWIPKHLWQYVEDCLLREKQDARRRMFKEFIEIPNESDLRYQSILSDSNGKLATYSQYERIACEILGIRQDMIPVFYYDLKDGDLDFQVKFWFDQVDILFTDNFPEMVEDFFDTQLSFIREGLEGEPATHYNIDNLNIKLDDKQVKFQKSLKNKLNEWKPNIVDKLGKRTFDIFQRMKIIPVRYYDYPKQDRPSAYFETIIFSEGKNYVIHCAEYSLDLVDWFQFATDVNKFEEIFRIYNSSQQYCKVQGIFEEMEIKEFLRENYSSDELFYNLINRN